jgi:hypothetical protein
LRREILEGARAVPLAQAGEGGKDSYTGRDGANVVRREAGDGEAGGCEYYEAGEEEDGKETSVTGGATEVGREVEEVSLETAMLGWWG